MPVDLAEMVAPSHTSVLTMELQRGVVGDLSPIPDLVSAVRDGQVIESTARLLGAARSVGARVVHCTAVFRPDRAGSATNSPMLAAMARQPGHLLVGTPPAELVAALGPEPSDLVSARMHGLSPFTGTGLDMLLRNMGTRTVVATGVSLNLGVVGMALEAVNLGYRVVVATDAVAGSPAAYADAVMSNTIPLLATRATVDEIAAAWRTADAGSRAQAPSPT